MQQNLPTSRPWPLLRYAAGGVATGALACVAGGPLLALPLSFALGALADWRTGSRVTSILTVAAGLLAATVAAALTPTVTLLGAGCLLTLLLAYWFGTIVHATWRQAYERVQEVQASLRYWPYSPDPAAEEESLHLTAYEQYESDNRALCN